ncbi:MAG: patatin-like phospholipase family protein [Xanthobacteraceae bacterium]
MSPLDSIPKLFDTETALRAETNAVHPDKPPVGDDVGGEALCRALHGRRSTALCLSGGGIRSASFALGVIEALAVHPRPAPNQQAPAEDQSLLCQFNYLSTVSGGGYIASWLSAWIARAGFPEVWTTLKGWRPYPDEEPSEIAWLRSYSNYLTPRTGLFSADTWAAVALYVRNLMLNWLVILPALCLALFAVKIAAVAAFWGSLLRVDFPRFFIIAGLIAMVIALRFALLNRPSRDPRTIKSGASEALGRHNYPAGMRDPHHNETARVRSGGDEAKFIWHCLIPAVLAALLISIYLLMRGPKLAEWGLFKAAAVSLVAGVAIYALAWILAWPPKTWVPCRDAASGRVDTRRGLYWAQDFVSWVAAGGVYGAIIGVGIHVIARSIETDATGNSWVWLLIGNANVDHASAVFLLAFIYGVPWIIMAQLIAEMVFVGLTSWQPYSDSDREWFGRSTGWFGVVAFGWFVATFLVLVAGEFVFWLVGEYASAKYSSAILAAASGLFSTVLGKSTKTSPEADAKPASWTNWSLPLGAIVFLILLVIGVSVVMDHLMFERGLIYTALMTVDPTLAAFNQALAAEGRAPLDRWQDVHWLGIGVTVVLIVAFFAWRGVNINRFSAHSVYRNRLIRGFLGASNPKRAPNPFTGFDEDDNIRMHRVWTADKRGWQPFHVINIALNIVNSKRLAWQERKAEPFIVTPLHCGSAASGLGFRETKEYADMEGGGISLGTALAISGAAASPSMGYNSSPLVTLMLTLFNVRLGWWLGNPGRHGDATYGEQGPSHAIKPFVMEMFGLTTDESDYVYLSDGGHFENLALYEMIRRRCRYIVLSDAGCDPDFSFEDLGNAVRKVAIDLGVYISFGGLRTLKKRSKDNSVIKGAYYAIGEIDYQTAPGGAQSSENGYILYIKPGYHGTESAGVVAYATANAAFPHESTADQFFSESQFESYHALGFEIMDGVLKKGLERIGQKPHPTISEIIEALARPDDDEKPPRLSDALRFLDKDDLAAARKILAP